MELTQSFLFSITRVKLGLYEQRILTKIVEFAQKALKGENRNVPKKIVSKLPNTHVAIKVAGLLDEGNDHYNHVYSAARSLMGRRFEYFDPDTKTWHGSPLIYNVTLRQSSGVLDFYVDTTLIDVILDMRKGWKAYDLETALTLPSPAAVRLYVLLSKQESPLTLKVDWLKHMFGVEDKYKQTNDFIKKVIDPAAAALTAANVVSFTYSKVTEHNEPIKKGQKCAALTLFPIRPKEKKECAAQISSHAEQVAFIAARKYLQTYSGFTDADLRIHNKTIKPFAVTVPDCISVLFGIDKISQRSSITNPKGFIISQMRDAIEAAKSKSS